MREAHWYPASWQQPDDPVPLRGPRVLLEGGPFDGRSAHVTDSDCALWVAKDDAHGDFIAVGWVERPPLPEHSRLVGRYVYVAADELLVWEPC